MKPKPKPCDKCGGTGKETWVVRGDTGDREIVTRKCQKCKGKKEI